ncbi:MAG TPA: MFS transporter [Streptosporangiaceae bacterium]|nr:MFS transporter [Streptosporangiaceae bacterium]
MTSLNSRRMPADPGHETEAGSSETSRLSNLGIGLLLLGVLLPQINYFGVNVALNTIRRSLGASPADLELIVAGYGTAYAIFLVIGGRLGDRYGRRRVFTIGLIGFLVASLGCGLAPSAILLVVFRILQGALGAATITVERRAERRGLVSLLPPSVLGLSSVRRGLSLHLALHAGLRGVHVRVRPGPSAGSARRSPDGGLATMPMAVPFLIASPWGSAA